MLKNKTIIFVSPHCDDVELACGGAIHSLSKNNQVYSVAISDCQETLDGSNFNKNQLAKESKKALNMLGIDKNNIFIHQLKNKHFASQARKIFLILEKLREQLKPDLVFIPPLTDTHEDHQTVAQQSLHVFRRDTSILMYEQPWNNLDFVPNFFIKLSQKNLASKLKALNFFASQKELGREYFNHEFITALAKVRGKQIKRNYAEAFQIIKLIYS